jgi:hypothetical protein
MPAIRQAHPYGYIHHPDRVEVYRKRDGWYLGDVQRISDVTRWNTIQRRKRFVVNGARFLRLQDAAKVLEG